MILFPILQLDVFSVPGCLFLALWCVGIVFFLRGFSKALWMTLNTHSAKGLQEANVRTPAFRELEETPRDRRRDWTLKQVTLVGSNLAVSFGVERVLAPSTSSERSSLLQ